MTTVRIGRITAARRARIHLAIDGRTGCGARNRAAVARECARPDLAQAKVLCRRCFTAARVAAAQTALYTATGTVAARNRSLLVDVVQAMKTPAELAAEQDLIARINATITAAAPVLALPPVERPAEWRARRDEYAKTHPQPQAA